MKSIDRMISNQALLVRWALIVGLLILVSGVGMLLYQVPAVQQVSVQVAKADTTINVESSLKGGSSATFGPITGSEGSWLNTNVASNKSIVLEIFSNATGAIFNSTGTMFKSTVALPSSTEYYVTTTNPSKVTLSTKGNVTLMTLAVATVNLQTTKHPVLWIGIALVAAGAMTVVYFSLPKEPASKRSLTPFR